MERWKQLARRLKGQVTALVFAYRDPRTPWLARLVVVCVVAYALSPVDLIPDPIPILGYLDDLILLPLGIALAIRLLPEDVWRDARHRATSAHLDSLPGGRVAAIVIVAVWIAFALAGLILAWHWWR